MSYVIDIVLILIVAISAYIGYRKGALKMMLSLLVVVVSLAGAWMVSYPAANTGYTLFFEQGVSQTVDAALENTTEEAVEGAVENLFRSNSLVGGVGKLVGFDTQQAVNRIVDEPLEQVGTVLKNEVVKPPVVLLLRCIAFLLAFALLWIVLYMLSKAIQKTTSVIPVVKGINALAGGFVGILIGALLCVALSVVLAYITQINPNGLFGITEITQDNSEVFRLILNGLRTIKG